MRSIMTSFTRQSLLNRLIVDGGFMFFALNDQFYVAFFSYHISTLVAAASRGSRRPAMRI